MVDVQPGGRTSRGTQLGSPAAATQRGAVPCLQLKRSKRDQGRIEIPTREELRAILSKAEGRWRPLIVTAMFTGLRASELRGLRWADVDLSRKVLTVSQRAPFVHTDTADRATPTTKHRPQRRRAA